MAAVMKKQMRRFFCILVLLFAGQAALAEPAVYMEGAIGLGVQSLHDEEDNAAASRVLKLGSGVQLLPFLSGGVVLYSWGVVKDNKSEDSINFDGLSAGWELVAHLPLSLKGLPTGPYFRYGGHCWSATITGLAQPWAKSGCSDLSAIGLAFSSDSRREGQASFYVEFSRTRFDEVTSGSLIAGIRNRF